MFSRLFVDFAIENRKNVLFIFLGMTACVFAAAEEKNHVGYEYLVGLLPFAILFGIGITLLIFWPLWIIKVRKKARSSDLSFRKYVMSDDYRATLKEYSKHLNK